ncbi:unnamed protein product [Diatraea saccharalis]|uniref:Uncharacterized protein n=1 Tax=Diatraea saccharalis TaxID=40085 RepID=A0A9P0G2J5_9NEOP|nr:unnamed protein product [Diatraea saccharalis]
MRIYGLPFSDPSSRMLTCDFMCNVLCDQMKTEVEICRSRTSEAAMCRARRLSAGCEWAAALKLLDTVDPWCCGEVRVACLVELRKSSELFAFAHTLVDAYPNSWISWYAVGCYYYLIGKSEFARRYLSKAKSLEPGAGCVWLAYGHSFANDNEHDQAMAAYFKVRYNYIKKMHSYDDIIIFFFLSKYV